MTAARARRPRRREVLFAAGVALAVLVAAEVFLRLVPIGREPYEAFYDDIYDLSYAMVPGASNPYSSIREALNVHGFRGAAYAEAKPAGTFRVLAMGDSCTFGFGVADDEAWPAVLEKRLNASGRFVPVQVINGAVPGTTLFQHLMVFRSRLARFRPDLVIDWSAPNWNPSIKLFRDRMKDPPFYVTLQRPLRRLALYRLLQKAIKKGPTEKAFYESYHAPRESMADAELREVNEGYLNDYAADLEDLRALSREGGFDLVFTNYPSREAVADRSLAPPRYDSPHMTALDAFCRRHGYPLLDLIAAERAAPAGADLFLDTVHPTPQGHALIAEVVERALVAAGKVPTKR